MRDLLPKTSGRRRKPEVRRQERMPPDEASSHTLIWQRGHRQ